MNSNKFRTLGMVLVGMALGGILGKIAADKLRAYMIAEEEWRKEAEEARAAYEKSSEDASEALELYQQPVDTETPLGEEKPKHERKKPKEPRDFTDYQKISQKPPLKDIPIEDEIDPTEDHKSGDKQPYLITLDQYSAGPVNAEHEKVVLTYYSVDGVLANEDEEVILNGDKLLGRNWKTKFGQKSDDPDSFYIRNNEEEIDYEICRVNKSYKVEVLGIAPEKPPKPKGTTRKVNKIDEEESGQE